MAIRTWLQKTFLDRRKSTALDYPPKRKKPWRAGSFPEMENFHSGNYDPPWVPDFPAPTPGVVDPDALPPQCAGRVLSLQDLEIVCGILEYDLSEYLRGAVGGIYFSPGINMTVDAQGNEAEISGTVLTLPNAPDGTESTIDFWYCDACGCGYKILELPTDCYVPHKYWRFYVTLASGKLYPTGELTVVIPYIALYKEHSFASGDLLNHSDETNWTGITVSASDEKGLEYDGLATSDATFAWNTTSDVYGSNVALPQWAVIEFDEAIVVKRYVVWTAQGGYSNPMSWVFQYSDNGTDWTTADIVVNSSPLPGPYRSADI